MNLKFVDKQNSSPISYSLKYQARKKNGNRLAISMRLFDSEVLLEALSGGLLESSCCVIVSAPSAQPMEDTSKIYPRRRAGIKTTLLPDGHLVLFDPSSEWAHTLNQTGAIVWEYCDGQTCLSDIGKIIGELSNRSQATSESVALVQELQSYGLLTFE